MSESAEKIEADRKALAAARERAGRFIRPGILRRSDVRHPRQGMYDLITNRLRVANIITEAATKPDTTEPPQPHTIFVCGKSACSHMITIMSNGEQVRARRSVAPVTLEAQAAEQGAEIITANCNVHGGLKFPSTEQIRTRLNVPPTPQPLPEPGA